MDAAVRYWSRATLRRNLRGAVPLMLLIAIGAGGAMAAGGVAGVILGRTAWAQAANAIGIPRGLPISLLTVAGVLAGMVALALALAVPAGFAAARARPAIAPREGE
jgi:hypothetical protein